MYYDAGRISIAKVKEVSPAGELFFTQDLALEGKECQCPRFYTKEV